MNINKEFFEKQLKKDGAVTVYSPDNIPLNISKEYFVTRVGSNPALNFDLDCEDLALYCEHMSLSLVRNNNN